MRLTPLVCLTPLLVSTSLISAQAAPPAAPTNLVVTAPDYRSLVLSWTDNSSDEGGFEISYRQGPSGTFFVLSQAAANQTTATFFIQNAPGLQTYEFRVRSYQQLGIDYSEYAGPVAVTTPAAVISPKHALTSLQTPFSYQIKSSHPSANSYSTQPLPDGLSLNPTTGLISGTPTVSGKFPVTLTVQHSGGQTATSTLLLNILPSPVPGPVAGPAPEIAPMTAGGPAQSVALAPLFYDPDTPAAVSVVTNVGTMNFGLYADNTPATVANFLGYVGRGDFTNTIFHRSVPDFIVQAGAFRADATGSAVPTQPAVVNEPGISNRRGTIAMAKIGGDPDSATNQFFVNLKDTNASNLDVQNSGFTVFGRVTGDGMTVADAIAALQRKNYFTINPAFTDTPVIGDPPAYDPSSLVRILSAVPIAPLSYTVSAEPAGIVAVSQNGVQLTLTPLAGGNAVVSLTATDLDAKTTTLAIPVTVTSSLTPYQTWAAAQNFALPAEGLPSADPDGDGILNSWEFLFGTTPKAANAYPLVPSLSGGNLTVTFPLTSADLATTPVTLESAETLEGPWTQRWSSANGFTHPWIASAPQTGNLFQVTAKDPQAATAAPRRFLRLRVTIP